MNEIFVARKALAETLTSSAVCTSVSRKGTESSIKGVQLSDRLLGQHRITLHTWW